MQQLAYSGILEVVRIRKEGYPVRMQFADIFVEFGPLLRLLGCEDSRHKTLTEGQMKAAADVLCKSYLPPTVFQIGNNQLFIKQAGVDQLQKALFDYKTAMAILIQKHERKRSAYVYYQELLYNVVTLQSLARMQIARRLVQRRKQELAVVAERERQSQIEAERQRQEAAEKARVGKLKLNIFFISLNIFTIFTKKTCYL